MMFVCLRRHSFPQIVSTPEERENILYFIAVSRIIQKKFNPLSDYGF